MVELAIQGSSGRIGDVQIDAILGVSGPRRWERTTVALESGAPITTHRQRQAFPLTVQIVVSDAEPYQGATLLGAWEDDHADLTRQRLEGIQAGGEEVEFFDGERFYRTPSGTRVWVIDEIDPEVVAGEVGVYRATITLGEVPRYTTEFTTAIVASAIDPALQDSLGDYTEHGRQSTTEVPDSVASGVTSSL